MSNVDLAPHSIEAEEAVLGAILVDPGALYDVMPFLSEDDFFIVRNGWIWRAITTINRRGDALDYLTVANELKQRGKLEETGGFGYLLDIVNRTPSALNIEGYGRIVENMAVRRRLLDATQQVARAAHSDESTIEDVIAASDKAMSYAIDRHVSTISKARSVEDVVVEVQVEACNWRDDPRDVRGLACGFYPFDIATGGFEKGLLYEIAARPGIGKSALAAQIILGLLLQGISVVLFSLEMTDKAMVRRMGVQRARVDATLLKEGRLPKNDFDRFMSVLDDIAQVRDRLLIESGSGVNVRTMKSIAKRFERDHNIGLVVIDTLNRVSSDGNSPYERMTMTSHSIADWAHESDYAILAPVQLSRANAKLANKRPTLDALRDSGAVEEDADWIGGLHREYAYANSEEERQKIEADGKEHLAELLVLKNRDGDSEKASEMYWNAKSVNFERLEKHTFDIDAGSTHAAYAAKEQ